MRPTLADGARARMLRVVRRQTGDVLWMARASRLPPGWRARARSDAARRDARPDDPPRTRGGLGGRMACPPGRGGWAIQPPRARLMRPASWRRRSGCSGAAPVQVRRATMRPHAWGMDATKCVRIVIRLRRSTVTWRRWALSGLTHVPMPGLN